MGNDRLRVGPWRGDPAVARIVPAPGQVPSGDSVARCLRDLAARGYHSAITSALAWNEQQPFLAASFTVQQRLHLLSRPLTDLPSVRPFPGRVRRGRRRDIASVLAVDEAAFNDFWRFDSDGIDDARRATPSSRFRVVEDPEVAAYAVTGRAGPVAYLQRLAVHPEHQRKGLGAALVVDALQWAARRRSRTMLVNTQETNTPALCLYEALGFEPVPNGLAVLERRLAEGGG